MKKLLDRIRAYISLTKPTILLLVIIAGAAGLVLEASLLSQPLRFCAVLLLLGLAGGSANGLNQYLERERDARMNRTRLKRPLPLKKILPVEALGFSLLIGLISVFSFWIYFNILSALLSTATILFYALFYTLYLKPRTTLNIVIGGAAGSMGPVIAWAAASGTLSLTSVLLFAIIFFWTPPHFWALAICYKGDYKAADLPMLPIIKSDEETWRIMLK